MKSFMAALLLAAPGIAFAQDLLTYAGGATDSVLFVSYDDAQFTFMRPDESTFRVRPAKVKSLALAQPAHVDMVTKSDAHKKPAVLLRFGAGQFVLQSGPKEISLAPIAVKSMVCSLGDQRRVSAPAGIVLSRGEGVDTNALAVPGRVSIVHFHSPSIVSSVRQGLLVARWAKESHDEFVFRQIIVTNWDDPTAIQFDLKSLPQFWLYDRDGSRVATLTDRFTDDDIRAAIEKASR